MKFYTISLLFLGLFIADVSAATSEFVMLEQKNLPNNLGVYRHIQWVPQNVDFYATTLNDNYHAKIYQQPAKTQITAQSIEDVTRDNQTQIGINGGFYSRSFKPVGLFIQEGKRYQKFSQSSLLTACMGTTKNGKIFLEKNPNHCLRAYSAMQTGSFLIEQGKISPDTELLSKKLTHIKSYFNPHHRTTVAESNDHKIILLVSSSATLQDVANFLKNHADLMGVKTITNALSLDGGASTGLFISFAEKPFYFSEGKFVKTFLLVN